MRALSLFAKVVMFMLLLAFAVKNSESVTVRYLLGFEWQAPLSLVLLVVFAVGVILGLIGGSRHLTGIRRKPVVADQA